jgi:excisionase family DNA binding protein
VIPVDDRWLSTQEAAARIGITSRTLYRRIDEGDLPAYKIGRLIKLKCSEVDAFIDAQRIKPGELSHLYPDMSDLDAVATSETDERGR